MNRELFEKIHDVISTSPESLDMGAWEWDAACGTTRCIAGWAMHFSVHDGRVFDPAGTVSQSVRDLADRLGARDEYGYTSFPSLAGELLGLDRVDRELFYVDSDLATEFVRLASEGREEEARALLHEGD